MNLTNKDSHLTFEACRIILDDIQNICHDQYEE